MARLRPGFSPVLPMVLNLLPVLEAVLRTSGIPEIQGKVDVYDAIKLLQEALITLQQR